MSETKANFRKLWWFHGVELTKTGSQFVGNCPFCTKDQHLYVNPENGMWDCKSCGESGNSFTFLSKLHQLSDSSQKSLQPLAENRGLKVETLQMAGVIKSVLTGQYSLPVKNAKGNVVNLYKAEESNGDGVTRYPIYSSPAPCHQHLYLSDMLRKNQTVFICEGHWDALAWMETLLHLQQRGDILVKKGRPDPEKSLYKVYDVVGAPGATTFPEEWLKLFSRRDLILLYDNDEAGQKGVRRLIKMMKESTIHFNSLRVLRWANDDPNDIRDLVTSVGYLEAFQHVAEKLVEVELEETEDDEPTVLPVDCRSFEELLGYYNSQLLMTDAIRDTLATMLALVLSVAANGTQLGLRVIGPPGSAKSTLAEAIGKCKALVYATSKFTGLISGFTNIKRASQIASRMNNKNCLIKDADMMTQMPNWKQVESEIRDALGDGVIRAEYRTGVSECIYTNFSVTMCGTARLKQVDDSQLGSRFVDIYILDKESNVDQIVLSALKSQFRKVQQSLSGEEEKDTNKGCISVIGPPTAGFLLFKKEQMERKVEFEDISNLRLLQIKSMAEIIVRTRARVARVSREELSYRPDQELATRVSEQLCRIGMMLTLIYQDANKITLNRKVIQVLQRITRDTCSGFQFEVIELLYFLPEGMTAEQLGWKLGFGVTQARKHCEDLIELGVLQRKKTKNIYGKGRKAHWYILADKIRETYKLAFSRR